MKIEKLNNPKKLCMACLYICFIIFVLLLIYNYSWAFNTYDKLYFVRVTIRDMFNYTGMLIPIIYFLIILFKKHIKHMKLLNICLIIQMIILSISWIIAISNKISVNSFDIINITYSLLNTIMCINLMYSINKRSKKVLLPFKLTNTLFIIAFVFATSHIGIFILQNFKSINLKYEILNLLINISRFLYIIIFNIYLNLYMKNIIKRRIENE